MLVKDAPQILGREPKLLGFSNEVDRILAQAFLAQVSGYSFLLLAASDSIFAESFSLKTSDVFSGTCQSSGRSPTDTSRGSLTSPSRVKTQGFDSSAIAGWELI